MQSSYAAQYRILYENHWWWRAREFLLMRILRRLLPTEDALRILDVGCGDGLFFPCLKQFGTPSGIEPDAALVTDRGLREGPIYIGKLDEQFEGSGPYDLITLLDVIEHIEDDRAILTQARRLLAVNGWIVVTVPAFMCLWTRHDDLNLHKRRYTSTSLRNALNDSGFEIADLRYAFHWPAIVKFALHFVEKISKPTNETASIPRPWINACLQKLCQLEILASEFLSIPFGSSIIAIARSPRAGRTHTN